MADRAASPVDLQWGRMPDGRFFVNIVIAVADPSSQLKLNGNKTKMLIPVYTIVLNEDEEGRLRDALVGLKIVTKLPEGGGPEGWQRLGELVTSLCIALGRQTSATISVSPA